MTTLPKNIPSVQTQSDDRSNPTQTKFEIIPRLYQVLMDKALTPSECRIACYLMLRAGKGGETKWSHKKLAETFGITERQTKRITKKLDKSGIIKSNQRGLKRFNSYVMPWRDGEEEVTATAESDVPEVTSMSPPMTPMSLPEGTPMSLPIEKELVLKDFDLKDTPKLASGPDVSFDQTQLQNLETELQRLIAATPGFVKARRIPPGTPKNIWAAAKQNCPEIEVNDLVMWLWQNARDGRKFNNWGGVVWLVENELESEGGYGGDPAHRLEQAENSESVFTPEEFRHHCNYCASELLKLESPSFEYDEVARYMLNDCGYAEYYMQNLEEAEDRMKYLEEKTVRRAMAELGREQQHEIHSLVNKALLPYLGKMTIDQRNLLGESYTRRFIFEKLQLPRFSLFNLDRAKRAAVIIDPPWRDIAHLKAEKRGDVLLEEEVDSLPIGPAFEQGFITESDLDQLEADGKYRPQALPPRQQTRAMAAA